MKFHPQNKSLMKISYNCVLVRDYYLQSQVGWHLGNHYTIHWLGVPLCRRLHRS